MRKERENVVYAKRDHGVVNLRQGSPLGMFGDDASREAWEQEAEAARRAMPAGRRFQVAPRISVTTPTGVTLAAGSEVNAAMLHGGTQPAWTLLEHWVITGRVLEADMPNQEKL